VSLYHIVFTKRARKDFNKLSASGRFNKKLFQKVVDILAAEKTLDSSCKDHQLKGSLKDYRECHIQNDLRLIYKKGFFASVGACESR
jgi:mRNA interferase YafQ